MDSADLNFGSSVGFVVFPVLVYILISIGGILVNRKFYKNVKQETHREKGKVIQRIMMTYAIVQAVGWPSIIWINILLRIDQVVFIIIPPCVYLFSMHAIRLLSIMLRMYVCFNSLVVAICRYLFIVWDEMISNFGLILIHKIRSCYRKKWLEQIKYRFYTDIKI